MRKLTVVNQRTAQHLASVGYQENTPLIWDRHNPQTRLGGKPSDPPVAWKLSEAHGHYDDVCCLAAPKPWKAAWFLVKLAWSALRETAHYG